MRLRLDAGQRILLICAEIRVKRLNSGQFRPNFQAESPASARINILWSRTQSNKPSIENILGELGSSLSSSVAAELADRCKISHDTALKRLSRADSPITWSSYKDVRRAYAGVGHRAKAQNKLHQKTHMVSF